MISDVPGLGHDDLILIDAVWSIDDGRLPSLIKAAQLDPKADFRGCDLRGWIFAGQDVRGIDFTGSDLRGTGVKYALKDDSTVFDGALLDPEGNEEFIEGLGDGEEVFRLLARAEQLTTHRQYKSAKSVAWAVLDMLPEKLVNRNRITLAPCRVRALCVLDVCGNYIDVGIEKSQVYFELIFWLRIIAEISRSDQDAARSGSELLHHAIDAEILRKHGREMIEIASLLLSGFDGNNTDYALRLRLLSLRRDMLARAQVFDAALADAQAAADLCDMIARDPSYVGVDNACLGADCKWASLLLRVGRTSEAFHVAQRAIERVVAHHIGYAATGFSVEFIDVLLVAINSSRLSRHGKIAGSSIEDGFLLLMSPEVIVRELAFGKGLVEATHRAVVSTMAKHQYYYGIEFARFERILRERLLEFGNSVEADRKLIRALKREAAAERHLGKKVDAARTIRRAIERCEALVQFKGSRQDQAQLSDLGAEALRIERMKAVPQVA